MKTTAFIALLLATVFFAASAHAATIDTVPIGDPGSGSVPYNYRIGKTEVTNAQYVEFLNTVGASDPFELYNTQMESDTRGGIVRSGSSGSFTYAVKADAVGQGPGGTDYTYDDKPVVFVSWYDSNRFANWVHNGQGEWRHGERRVHALGRYAHAFQRRQHHAQCRRSLVSAECG